MVHFISVVFAIRNFDRSFSFSRTCDLKVYKLKWSCQEAPNNIYLNEIPGP